VNGLGEFLELEVVLRPGQSEADGRKIASALLAEAYVDLLARKANHSEVQKVVASPIADRDSNR